MMRATIVLGVLALLCGVGVAEEAKDPRPVPFELPRLHTLGEAPTGDDVIVVEILRDGIIRLEGGAPLSLTALREALQHRTRDPDTREDDGTSKRRLVVRADARVPWLVVRWVLALAADPRVRLLRSYLAATSRDGAAAGALYVPLPRDRGLSRRPFEWQGEVVDVRVVRGRGDASDPESLLPRLRSLIEAGHPQRGVELAFVLRAPAPRGQAVPHGFVLRLLEVARRAGFHRVGLGWGAPPKAADAQDADRLRALVARLRRADGRDRIWIGSDVVAAEAAPPAEEGDAGRRSGRYGFRVGYDVGDLDDLEEEEGAESEGTLDTGVTALALLAYLGAGYTGYGDHPFMETVKRGIKHLLRTQREDGSFEPTPSMHGNYANALAATVLIEAYGMTRNRALIEPARKALRYVQAARNPYFAWRYGVKPGDNDTSVTAWMLTAIHAARLVNERAVGAGGAKVFQIDAGAFDGAHAWVEKMTDERTGRVGYIQRGGSSARRKELIDRFPGDRAEAMTAAGLWIRVLCGEDARKHPRAKQARKLLLARPPRRNPKQGETDFYYWYWGTLALHQVGGLDWERWWRQLCPTLLRNQRRHAKDGTHRGSWDPVGPWGPDGGRVYTTAILCLALETPYRYPRDKP